MSVVATDRFSDRDLPVVDLDETPKLDQARDLEQTTVEQRTKKKLSRLAWSVLGYNVAVVLWGAFVRASGSGAGCGRHWPLCNGEVLPQPKSMATVIEAAHRVTSGIAVALVLVLLLATLVGLPQGHRARRGAAFATAFIFGEAAIGAGLVLFELVAHDDSMKRALSMILHLCNTFFLLGALALTAWWISHSSSGTSPPTPPTPRFTRSEARAREDAPRGAPNSTAPLLLRVVLTLSLGGVMLLGASGAIAALGDTLFPATSLREGFAQDLSPMTHAFLRLRLFHPVIALCSGVLVLGSAGVVRALTTAPRPRLLARIVTLLFVMQFMIGLLNISLLAPIPVQLLHLLFAEATWISLVLMAWESWRGVDAVEAPAVESQT